MGSALFGQALIAAMFCSAAPSPAQAQLVPLWRLKDEVGVVSEAGRRDIIQRLSVFELHTKRQFAVWIKAELPESQIDELVAAKFTQWELGDADTNRGALLLTISVSDRSAYVAVNYDLEKVITDEVSQRIVRDVMQPILEQRMYDDAIDAGLRALMVQAEGHGPWEELGARQAGEAPEPQNLSEAIVMNDMGFGSVSFRSRYVWPSFFFFALSAYLLAWGAVAVRGDVSLRTRRRLGWVATGTAALTLTGYQVFVGHDSHWEQWPGTLFAAIVLLLAPWPRLSLLLFRRLRTVRHRYVRLWLARALSMQALGLLLTAADCLFAQELRPWARWPLTWVLGVQFAALCLGVLNESVVLVLPRAVRRQWRFPVAWVACLAILGVLSAAMLRLM